MPLIPVCPVQPAPALVARKPPPGQKRPGPGDPLPPFTFSAAGSLTTPKNEKGDKLIAVDGGFVLLWGDLRLEGERILVDYTNQRLQAFGHVVLRRGDEEIHGENLTLDGTTGRIEIQKASAVSPPFYFVGDHITRTPDNFIAYDSTLSLRQDGAGEIKFRAAEIQLENSERLILRNTTIYLYNRPIFRVRHLALSVDLDPRYGGSGGRHTPPPVSFRVSQISGTTVGLGSSLAPFRNYAGGFLVDFSSRQGIQYGLTMEHSLVGQRPGDVSRRLTSSPAGRAKDESPELPSTPLRQLLTARVPPAPRDPVLDYVDILSTTDPLSQPTRFAPRDLSIYAALMGNREFGGSRFGPLLLSRQPELSLIGQLPLSPPADVNNNETARRALHSPRFYLSGDIGYGRYSEVRLNNDRMRLTEQRDNGGLSIGFNPLLVGKSLLTSGQVTWRTNRYSTDTTYRVMETNLSAGYVFATRTMLGGSLITRSVSGQTPFFFDRIDTQNEAQIRGQVPLLGSRYTLAALGRYDLSQGRLFDVEIAIGIRGVVLEPRFSYRKLNGTIGFNLAIPRLTTP